MTTEAPCRRHARGAAGRLTATLLFGAALLARPAAAQDSGRWEVGAFAGSSFGTRIFLDESTDISIGRDTAYGLRGAWSIDRSFSLELTLSRARSHLDALDPATGSPLAPSAPIDVNTYEVDGLYGFGKGRVRGYMGLGAGAMTLHPFVPGVATEADTRFVANVAIGGKLYLGERFALRVDGRYRWRSAQPGPGPSSAGTSAATGSRATSTRAPRSPRACRTGSGEHACGTSRPRRRRRRLPPSWRRRRGGRNRRSASSRPRRRSPSRSSCPGPSAGTSRRRTSRSSRWRP